MDTEDPVAARVRANLTRRPVSPLWSAAERTPLRRWASQLAQVRRDQLEGGRFFGERYGAQAESELREYLGDRFDPSLLESHRAAVEEEEAAAGDELTFYRTSVAYLYDLTRFATWGTKEPYLAAIRRCLPAPARLLDYGCGIGTDGLRFLSEGYDVDFADFANPSTEYLRWRLQRRGISGSAVLDVEGEIAGGYDLVYCFDVVEHVEDPFAFLARLESLGRLVAINFLRPDPDDTTVHHPLPLAALLGHAFRRGVSFYHCYEKRSHFVIYGSAPAASSAREMAGGAGHLVLDWVADRFGPLRAGRRRGGRGGG